MALRWELTQERDDGGLWRRLHEAVNAAGLFRELRELFAAQGFVVKLRALDKLEPVREVEIAQRAIDPKQFDRAPSPASRSTPASGSIWARLGGPDHVGACT